MGILHIEPKAVYTFRGSAEPANEGCQKMKENIACPNCDSTQIKKWSHPQSVNGKYKKLLDFFLKFYKLPDA